MQHDARLQAADLIGEIYAALLGNGSWQSFLDTLSGILPNGKPTLFYHDYVAGGGEFSLSSRFEPERLAAYKSYYAAKNPWMAKAVGRPLDVGVRAEQMLTREHLLRTEFYADYLRPQGCETAVGVTIFRERGCNFMLSLLCAPADEARIQSATSLLGMLAPHLRQAFTYYRRAGGIASGLVTVDAAADALGVAIVSVGCDRRVLWSNTAGRALLALGDPIGTSASGHIRVARGELRETVDLALAAAMRGDGPRKTTITLRAADDSQPVTRITCVVPALSSSERFFTGPCVVLLIETVAAGTLPPEEALRSTFALTRSEARLACALADGASVADLAAQLGITRETVRAHLKHIFAKMNVGRQAELVAKVYRCRGAGG